MSTRFWPIWIPGFVDLERRRLEPIEQRHAENVAAMMRMPTEPMRSSADLGAAGLWLNNGGSWTQLSGVNADQVTTANLEGTGLAEIIGDFGASGLWLWKAGGWTQLSGANADYVTSGIKAASAAILSATWADGIWT